VVGGVGVAGLAIGVVTGFMAMGDASTFKANCTSNGACSNQAGVDAASAGKTASALSTAGFIGGAVLTGVGVYLLLTSAPTSPSGPASPPSVGVMSLPGGAGLSFVGGF
jgi:hypothetical protein